MKERIRKKIHWKQHLLGSMLFLLCLAGMYYVYNSNTQHIIEENLYNYEQLNHNQEIAERVVGEQIKNLKSAIQLKPEFKPFADALAAGVSIFDAYNELEEDATKKAEQNNKVSDLEELQKVEQDFYEAMIAYIEWFNWPEYTIDSAIQPALDTFEMLLGDYQKSISSTAQNVTLTDFLFHLHKRRAEVYLIYSKAFDLLDYTGLNKRNNRPLYAITTNTFDTTFQVNKAVTLKFELEALYNLKNDFYHLVMEGDTLNRTDKYFKVPVKPENIGLNKQLLVIHEKSPLTGKTRQLHYELKYKAIPKPQ